MAWHGQLDLVFRRDGDRSIAVHRHSGPLRLLKSLHPEGPPDGTKLVTVHQPIP